MFKCTIIHKETEITIEVIKNLEGFKVRSTLHAPKGDMVLQSPDTWARESRANQEAQAWVIHQSR